MQTPSDSATTAENRFRVETPKPASARSVFSNFRAEPAVEEEEVVAAIPAQPVNAAIETLQVQIDRSVARSFIYRFLAKAFEDPNRAGWQWLSDPQVKLSLLLAVKGVGSGSALQQAGETLFSSLTPADYEPFNCHFVAAFGHTVRGDCPMNEIEYGDIKADPLFQPHRLADLAAFYSAFGLQICDDAGERQDHICLELEFMSVLTMKEGYALESQSDPENLEVCREAQKTFLREHLGRWTPAFTRRLRKIVGQGALGALADFTREFVFAECASVGVTPGSEDLMLRAVDESAEKLCESCGINSVLPGALATAQ